MKKVYPLKKWGILLLALVLLVSIMTGCSSSEEESASSTSASASASTAQEKIKVSVGIGNGYSPFCFLDEDEELSGYDYETIAAIAELLSDKYEFEYTAEEFSNLLIGVDTGAYDVVIHHFGYTAERAENYLYANVANMYYGNFQLGYKAGRTDITDMKSLAGKTVVSSSGSMADTLLQNWNEENPDYQINIEYASDKEVRYSGLMNSLYDAFLASTYDLAVFNSQYDDFMDISDYNVIPDDYNCGTYFIYAKGSEELQQDIDAALQQLIDDGTLSALSIEWLGADYTENPNA